VQKWKQPRVEKQTLTSFNVSIADQNVLRHICVVCYWNVVIAIYVSSRSIRGSIENTTDRPIGCSSQRTSEPSARVAVVAVTASSTEAKASSRSARGSTGSRST
jgi:hypothetical protein